MIPVIIYLSHYTGKIWMGKNAQTISFTDEITLAFIHNHFVQYMLGAITLSIAAGAVFGIVSYGLIKLFKKKPATPM
jgi:xanthine/uracil/vitamin C permease (AzgA family)